MKKGCRFRQPFLIQDSLLIMIVKVGGDAF